LLENSLSGNLWKVRPKIASLAGCGKTPVQAGFGKNASAVKAFCAGLTPLVGSLGIKDLALVFGHVFEK
jgi:hypothetical protein